MRWESVWKKAVRVCFSVFVCFLLVSCGTVQERKKPRHLQEELTRAQEMFAHHDYEASAQVNRQVLANAGDKSPADKALFNLGVIYSYPHNPRRDPAQAVTFFKRLQNDFPDSAWIDQASLWMETIKEIERLKRASAEALQENERVKKIAAEAQQENQKLKQIVERSRMVDIEIDEKKRSRVTK